MSVAGLLLAKFPMAGEYVLNIYLIERDYGLATNARLSGWLHVSRSAVSQAIKRLDSLDLVRGDEEGYHLTASGRELAVTLLKRHYLVERLLVETLEYPWDKADEEASRLQDKVSEEFTSFLFEKMGRPTTCPHGNPFPDSPDESRLLGAKKLVHARVGSNISILRITEEGEAFPGLLSFCFQNRIRPGNRFTVGEPDQEILPLVPETGIPVRIPLKFCEHLRIEVLNHDT